MDKYGRKYAVLVPTKNRPLVISKFIVKHLDSLNKKGVDLIISLEEQDKTFKQINLHGVKVVKLSERNKGIGYARNILVQFAYDEGYTRCLFSDDNSIWKDDNILDFLDKITGDIKYIGAWNRLYEFFGSANLNIVYGVDIRSVMYIGNYDVKAYFMEDNDLIFRLKKEYGVRCAINSEDIIFSKHRHEEGGLTNFKNRERFIKIAKYFNEKYNGNYFNYSEKKNTVVINKKKLEKDFYEKSLSE